MFLTNYAINPEKMLCMKEKKKMPSPVALKRNKKEVSECAKKKLKALLVTGPTVFNNSLLPFYCLLMVGALVTTRPLTGADKLATHSEPPSDVRFIFPRTREIALERERVFGVRFYGDTSQRERERKKCIALLLRGLSAEDGVTINQHEFPAKLTLLFFFLYAENSSFSRFAIPANVIMRMVIPTLSLLSHFD